MFKGQPDTLDMEDPRDLIGDILALAKIEESSTSPPVPSAAAP